jgi:hypothetical protein
MTEPNAVQRLSRAARRQGLRLSSRLHPARHSRHYRLIELETGRTLIETESLAEIERHLAAADFASSIYADYYLRL